MNQHGPNAAERFDAAYVPVPWTGCWLWINSGIQGGYGRIKISGKNILAHRYSYERFVGPIPTGTLVCHRCDVPPCVNPDYLFLGDDMANSVEKLLRSASKGTEAWR